MKKLNCSNSGILHSLSQAGFSELAQEALLACGFKRPEVFIPVLKEAGLCICESILQICEQPGTCDKQRSLLSATFICKTAKIC